MADTVVSTTFKYIGKFNWDDLYYTIIGFWGDLEHDVVEKTYKRKEDEVELEILTDFNVTNFIKNNVTTEIHIFNRKELGNGIIQAKIEVKVKGEITYDYEGRWSGKWNKKLLEIYMNYIFKKKYSFEYLTPFESQIWRYVDKLQEILRSEDE